MWEQKPSALTNSPKRSVSKKRKLLYPKLKEKYEPATTDSERSDVLTERSDSSESETEFSTESGSDTLSHSDNEETFGDETETSDG
jgi:hypothetical protein